ncbi:cadherin-like domain-containing protein, partial [Bradyrhizobium sp.]|uniref:cadherin-like domain-containing protein n=1 Tax=Bradyrhizobium sp. TaxID=376 RepID=UPI002B47A845
MAHLNYAGGKFDANGLGSHSSGYVNFEALPHHNHAETITVPDAHLLFAGDFERSGNDLIISDREHRLVVNDYFQGDKRPILMSPDGAPLDIKVVEALTGHTAYAQAGAPPAPKLVGHVVKLTGSASIVRNGVTIDVNTGDNVYQNDVVQTGSGSTVGLVLNDGTTFNMTANARLMLNDLVYDANSTSNTALFTLVQGAANFVAGQVAKTGDMKVATPVASIGIRGTAVILDISSTDGKVSISVVDQQDGQVHAVQVFNTRGDLIGTVTSNGASLTLTPTANFDVIAQQSNKTPAQVAQEFNAFQQVLSTYDVGKQQVPNLPPPTDGRRGDANPQSTTKFAGSTPVAPSDTPVTTLGTVGANTKNPVEIALADALSGKSTSSTSTGGATTSSNSSTQQQPATTIVVSDNNVVLQQVTIPPIAIPFVVTRPQVTLISTGAGDHFGPVMSADGRFVTYDPDGAIFLYDRQSNVTATIASPANGFTYSVPSISSDGHYIVYQGSNGTQSFVFIYDNNPSDAAYQQTRQLAPGSAPAISGNGSTIVVEQVGGSIGVYDQQGHALASITPAAIGATGSLLKPAISADGHVIAFWNADGAPGGSGELFVYNVSTAGVAAIASTVTGAGNTAASVSADGHYVVYQSDASDGHSEIFLYDLTAGHVVFQTANAGGASYNPVISPDGHFIIFASDARLTADDTNSVADTYVVDVTDPSHPVFKLVSALADGTVGNAASNLGASISAGGLFVAFGSNASNLSSGTGGSGNIFVVDPSSGHSAVIQESAHAPAVLTASGLIELTGNSSGVTLTVSDPSGHFSAAFDANGNIQWNFSEVKSDFASLVPGQLVSRDYVITLSTEISTTTIPVKVSIFDADLPGVTLADVPPVASLVTLAQGQENVPYTITAADLLVGVVDIDGPSLSITSVSVASGGGSVIDNHDGTWTYTPQVGFFGVATFNYSASDGTLSTSSTASLTLVAPDQAPVATPVTLAAGTEDTAYVINASALLAGVTDVDGPSLSITSVSVASGGGSVIDNH